MDIRDRVRELRRVKARDLRPNPRNWRRHPKYQREAMAGMLAEVGYADALIARELPDGSLILVDGHLRAETTPDAEVPVLVLDVTEAEADKLLATLDPLAAMAQANQDALLALLPTVEVKGPSTNAMLEALANGSYESLTPMPFPGGDAEVRPDVQHLTLAERFLIPPFSVLDARQGYWQDRKRAWLALGIRSELGRGDGVNGGAKLANGRSPARTFGQDLMRGEHVIGKNNLTWVGGNRDAQDMDETSRKNLAAGGSQGQSGTSICDPVLCELSYRWFCPPGGRILDPFAGGSVRGIVASVLGYRYTGIDLRSEQVAANIAQAIQITPSVVPSWIVGDARDVAVLVSDTYDFLFSCPPYFDLEQYSDDPADLSNARDYETFLQAYRSIIAESVRMLRDNRFACFCVGDIRDGKGFYRNFVADTISAFSDSGMALYNDAVLVTAVGSLPLRVGKQFGAYRKLGKTHQNILIFYKGDPRCIPAEQGPVDVT